MPARKKKTRSRRRKNFSILGAVESFAYASILSKGLFNTSPQDFLFGEDDLSGSYGGSWNFDAVSGAVAMNPTTYGANIGADKVTLRELLANPGFVAATVIGRGQANLLNMAFSAAGVAVGMRLFKRMLRRPLSNIQRNLVKPALGPGVVLG